MNRIGIISGGGKLPLIIGQKLSTSKTKVIYFCIKKYCNQKDYKNLLSESISINSLGNILKILRKNKINKIVMAGNIRRPSIKDIKFDFHSLKLIKNFALDSKGDDKLLSAISIFFKNSGFSILNWQKKCKDIFIQDDYITKIKPSKVAMNNLKKGLSIFKTIGKADLSQSMVVQNRIILGLEAAEGTDELIKRCFKYKKLGDKGILIKLSKHNQSTKFDVPVIGLNTVKIIKKYNYEGVFLEKNKCIILEKERVIKFCNLNNLFISSTIKN